jgi:pyruvate dehydrogenase E2 component (dihydrolipoamide acetyltransferase)
MVFLHGFGADMTGWRPAWASLEAGHRILGIDLPGHGRSPATGAATLAALVDAVREVLREESVERAHLVGHSLGGAVALGLAEAGVIDMRSLALIAPAGLGPEIDGDFLAGFLRAERVDSLTPWLRRLFADPQWVTPAFARAAMEKHADAAARAQQAALAGTLFPDGTQAIDLRGALARLAMPVKVIWGVRDAILPFRQSAGLPPLVALHAIPGAGHMPHLEARETVVTLLAELRRTDAAPGSA